LGKYRFNVEIRRPTRCGVKVDRAGGGGGEEGGGGGFEVVGGGDDNVFLKLRDFMRSVEWSEEEEEEEEEEGGKMLLYMDIMAKECSRNISM
jgi:hypothetical protein